MPEEVGPVPRDRIFVGGGVLKDKGMACERCVWGRGVHAEFCPRLTASTPYDGLTAKLEDIDWLIRKAEEEERDAG